MASIRMCADVWRVRTWRHKKVSASPLPNNFSNLQTINDMWTGGGPMTASYISPLLYLCSAFERSLMDCQRKRGLVVPRKCSKPNPSENLNVSRPRRRKSKKRRLGEKKKNSAFTLILSGESLHRQLLNVSTKLQSGCEAIWWQFTLFWKFGSLWNVSTFVSLFCRSQDRRVVLKSLAWLGGGQLVSRPCLTSRSAILPNRGHPC